MSAELYIEGNPIDLPSGISVSTKIQRIDIADISARKVNHTKDISISETENNLRYTGFAFDVNSISSKPYQKLPAKYVQNGIELIPNGKAIFRNVNDKLTLNVFEEIIDYFSAIRGLNVGQLNAIPDSGWTAADIDSARLNTSGIKSAVLSWGKQSIYNSSYFLPCFYYHTFISAILEYTGLAVSGSVMTSDDFLDLVIPYPGDKFEYPQSLIDPLKAKAFSIGNDFAVSSSTKYTVEFNSNVYGSIPTQYTLDPEIASINITIDATINVENLTWFTATTLTAKLYKYSGGVETELDTALVASSPSVTGASTLSYTGSFLGGDLIYVKLQSDAALLPGVTGDVSDDSFLQIDASTAVNRVNVMWKYLMPEIKCEDLIKDFFTRFGIIPKLDGGTLVLKTIQEIITDRQNAIDWSLKRIPGTKIDFSVRYAQSNTFNYIDSEDVKNPALGRGSLDISNDSLDLIKEIYTSIFANSESRTIGGYNVAHIPVYSKELRKDFTFVSITNSGGFVRLVLDISFGDVSDSFDIGDSVYFQTDSGVYATTGTVTGSSYSAPNTLITLSTAYVSSSSGYVNNESDISSISQFESKPGLRLLTLKARTTENAITFNSTSRTDYDLAYFVDPTQSKDTGFAYFLSVYYAAFLSAIQLNKVTDEAFNLDELDIASYDHHKLIWNGEYYSILELINDFVGAEFSTNVKLFKVS